MSETLQTWSARFDPQAPLLIIGAGRSGSTLLVRMLDAHPLASVKGETDFLTARLWEHLWTRRFWLDWDRFVATEPASSRDPRPTISADELARQEQRVGAVIARTVADTLSPDRDAQVWGFKEVWNGSQNHDYPWQTYDIVYPRATWIHLVRHPLDFVRSCAAWNRDELTREQVRHRLIDWCGMVDRSRERANLGNRWVEIRYEDLIAAPQPSLEPVLELLGMDWDAACSAPLAHRLLRSTAQAQMASVPRLVVSVPHDRRLSRLHELAESLDYDLSELRWADDH